MLNVAFEIGFDHYRFSLPLDITRFSDQHRQQIRYGYQAANLQKVTQKNPIVMKINDSPYVIAP